MGSQKGKRPELDPPHSKRSREGVRTVLCDLDATIVVAPENKSDSKECADSQLLYSLKHDEQAFRAARQLR